MHQCLSLEPPWLVNRCVVVCARTAAVGVYPGVYPGVPPVSPRPMAAQRLPRREEAGLDEHQEDFLQSGRALGWRWAWLHALRSRGRGGRGVQQCAEKFVR